MDLFDLGLAVAGNLLLRELLTTWYAAQISRHFSNQVEYLIMGVWMRCVRTG